MVTPRGRTLLCAGAKGGLKKREIRNRLRCLFRGLRPPGAKARHYCQDRLPCSLMRLADPPIEFCPGECGHIGLTASALSGGDSLGVAAGQDLLPLWVTFSGLLVVHMRFSDRFASPASERAAPFIPPCASQRRGRRRSTETRRKRVTCTLASGTARTLPAQRAGRGVYRRWTLVRDVCTGRPRGRLS